MDLLDQIRDWIQREDPCSQLTLLSEAQEAQLPREYPGIPEHYLGYLRRVGWGNVAGLMFYGGPTSAASVLGAERAAHLQGIVLIADDFAGWSLGFDTLNGWKLVGLDSASPEPLPQSALTLAELVSEWIANQAI